MPRTVQGVSRHGPYGYTVGRSFCDQDSFVQDCVTPQHRRGLAGRRGIKSRAAAFLPTETGLRRWA